jgi:hypothetical protein
MLKQLEERRTWCGLLPSCSLRDSNPLRRIVSYTNLWFQKYFEASERSDNNGMLKYARRMQLSRVLVTQLTPLRIHQKSLPHLQKASSQSLAARPAHQYS